MGDLRIRLRVDGTGAREAASSAASPVDPHASEIEQSEKEALRFGFMKRGTLPGTYRTYHGHAYDQVISALQKSGVRRELAEQTEYHLFECLLFLELGPKDSMGIITNLLNRLKIALVEDTLAFLTPKVAIAVLDDFNRFESADRTLARAFYVRRAFYFICSATNKCRLPSDLKAYYFDLPNAGKASDQCLKAIKQRAHFQTKQISPTELSRLLFSKQQPGDDRAALVDIALFMRHFEQGSPDCFYFAFQVLINTSQYKSSGTHSFSPANRADPSKVNRKSVDYLLWKVLETFIEKQMSVSVSGESGPIHRTSKMKLQFVRYMRQLYTRIHGKGEAYMCFVQAAMIYFHAPKVIEYMDEEAFESLKSSSELLAELDVHRQAKKRDIAAVEPWAIDMHTAAGRKEGKNRLDFAEEGAALSAEAAEFAHYSRDEWRKAFKEFKQHQVNHPLKRKRKSPEEKETSSDKKKKTKAKEKKKRKADPDSEGDEPTPKKQRTKIKWMGEENNSESSSDEEEKEDQEELQQPVVAAKKKASVSKMSKLRQQAGKQRSFMAQQTSMRKKISAAMVAAPAASRSAALASASALAAAAVKAMEATLAQRKEEAAAAEKNAKKLRLHYDVDHPLRPRVLLDRRVTVHDHQLLRYPYYSNTKDKKDVLPIWYCSVKHKTKMGRVLRLLVQPTPVGFNAPVVLIDQIKGSLGLVHGHSSMWTDPAHPDIHWLIRKDRGIHLLEGGKYPTEKDELGSKVAHETGMQSLASFLKSPRCPAFDSSDVFWRSVWCVLMWRFILAAKNTNIDTLMVLDYKNQTGDIRFHAYSFDECSLVDPESAPQFKRPGLRQLFDQVPSSEFLFDFNVTRPTKYLREVLDEWSKELAKGKTALHAVLLARCKRASVLLGKSAFRLV